MSTRSVIVVTGKSRNGSSHTVRLYKHSDGYPTGALATLYAALQTTNSQCDELLRRFGYEADHAPVVEQVVGNIIGAGTDCYGMGIRIDDDGDGRPACFCSSFALDHLGNQSDLEWQYLLDLEKRCLRIFGGGFTGQLPQVAFERGEIDPVTYADQLKAEYRMKEREEVKKLVEAIEAVGIAINPKPRGRRRSSSELKVRKTRALPSATRLKA